MTTLPADIIGATDDRLLVSVKEAARLLSLGETATWALLMSNEIPSVKVGRRRLVPVERLRQWVDAHA